MKRAWILLLLPISAAAGAETPRDARREIAQLMSVLAASSCQFQRNGTWYDARKASAHLRRKYDYLDRRGGLATTEAFIDQAATASSVSGKPYQVRCGSGKPVDSRTWFTRELQALRDAP